MDQGDNESTGLAPSGRSDSERTEVIASCRSNSESTEVAPSSRCESEVQKIILLQDTQYHQVLKLETRQQK